MFIKLFSAVVGAGIDSVSSTLKDQWTEFYVPRKDITATSVVFNAVRNTDNSNDINKNPSVNIITNGSKILVPEGTALITMQDGEITGFIAEPGGFAFNSADPNSKSIFAGDGFGGIIQSTLERYKFGGTPGTQQLAFYVNLKEIPNNRFGTQSEIYWDDAFFGTQVGVVTRGTYTLKVVDPLLFIKNFVPAKYLQPGAPVFDLADMDNEAGEQLFSEVVGTLSAAFSNYTNDPSKGNRISKIQGDQIGFAQAMSQAVEQAYQWKTDRGLEIVKTAILAIEYDEDTKKLMKDVKAADALSGARGNAFMQQAAARGMQAAGENGGGTGMAFMGMGMQAAGGMMGGMQQPNTPPAYQPQFQNPAQPAPVPAESNTPAAAPVQDSTTKLLEMKKLLDAGAISQAEYDAVKAKILGL